jgi:hypothetical protein
MTPEMFLRRFEHHGGNSPTEMQFAVGIPIIHEWIRLRSQPTLSQEDLDRLLSRFSRDPYGGSQIADLYCHVASWGRELGLSVPREHPWVSPPTTPEAFRRYFQDGLGENPGDQQMTLGLQIALEWKSLYYKRTVSQDELDRLLGTLHQYRRRNAATADYLWLYVGIWGRQLGFSVPWDPPWWSPPTRA